MAWRAPTGGIVFSRMKGWSDLVGLTLPCSQCIGCRMDRSAAWATRIRHEVDYHECASFVTLTYNDESLPDDYSISTRAIQLFNKRVRHACGPFRFFACGEYGDHNLRPHYHAVLFGLDFASDRTPWRKSSSGFITYRSSLLEKLWPFGHSEIGTVTTQSAGYVARYCLKKVTGKAAEDHYRRIHPLTGEINSVRPEFVIMSRKPGIGRKWIDDYKSDVFPSDFLILDGKKRPVPRYYKEQLSELEQDQIIAQRVQKAQQHKDNNSDPRLVVREEVQQRKADRLLRKMDEDQ